MGSATVIGSPRETRDQILATYEFIRRSQLDLFDVYLLTPYPGTPVWDYAKERGLVTDDMQDRSVLGVNHYRYPDKAIFMSEVLIKLESISLYSKFRRLRLRRNLTKVWNHPLPGDIPRMAARLVAEKTAARAQAPERTSTFERLTCPVCLSFPREIVSGIRQMDDLSRLERVYARICGTR